MTSQQVKNELQKFADREKAKLLSRFFKTGKGEYGEGDVFIGVKVPEQRVVAKKNKDLQLSEVKKLLASKVHEHRLTALLILTYQFPTADEKEKKSIFCFYLKHTKYINNWDLIDLSAPRIVGSFLKNKDRSILYNLAKSRSLWEKRISILSTFMFINNRDFKDALKISELLLNDSHDLIHKAVGWALREIGKRDLEAEEEFLKKFYKKMPRTMLRYAIEKFPDHKRRAYLQGDI